MSWLKKKSEKNIDDKVGDNFSDPNDYSEPAESFNVSSISTAGPKGDDNAAQTRWAGEPYWLSEFRLFIKNKLPQPYQYN